MITIANQERVVATANRDRTGGLAQSGAVARVRNADREPTAALIQTEAHGGVPVKAVLGVAVAAETVRGGVVRAPVARLAISK